MRGEEAQMSLWMPILVATVAVFVASSIVWMVLPHHRTDFKKLPDEDGLLAALRKQPVPVGQYMFPHCAGPADMKDPAKKAKWETGPVGVAVIRPSGMPAMGKQLATWAVFILFVEAVVAYLARHALPNGAPGVEVMRIVGTAAGLGFAMAQVPESIWLGRPWSVTVKNVVDAAVYALITAIVFRLFWPAAV
jgi:hypothetical protein